MEAVMWLIERTFIYFGTYELTQKQIGKDFDKSSRRGSAEVECTRTIFIQF